MVKTGTAAKDTCRNYPLLIKDWRIQNLYSTSLSRLLMVSVPVLMHLDVGAGLSSLGKQDKKR
ncbi:MAG: hypothetical protein KAW93_10520 [Methanogenium sp.]|nr:hypothetical protein [Methanogenium sp.]